MNEFTLEYRYSHNDAWTSNTFNDLESLKEEVVYKVLQGWEVRLDEKTRALDLVI